VQPSKLYKTVTLSRRFYATAARVVLADGYCTAGHGLAERCDHLQAITAISSQEAMWLHM
jgi:hypothetical protein